VLALVALVGCDDPEADDGPRQFQGRLSSPGRAGVPRPGSSTVYPRPFTPSAPDPVETEETRGAKSVDRIGNPWRRSGAVDVVVEGEIVDKFVTVVQAPDQKMTKRPNLIMTRYRLAVSTAWPKTSGPADEFWVLGGVLPADTPPSDQYPRGEGFSFESYPEVGDRVFVGVKVRSLPSIGTLRKAVEGGITKIDDKNRDLVPRIRSMLDETFQAR